MKRKFVFLLILLGCIGVIYGVVKFVNNRTPKQGVLKVTSSPAVSVFLDNKHLGRSPYEDKVDGGEYTVKLVPESTVEPVTSWQGKIKVLPNLLTYVNAELSESEFNSSIDILWLEKISGKDSEIALTTNPDGTSVSLDGEPKGTTPLMMSNVVPGDHTIAIASTGFVPRTIKVKTTPGYKLIATVKLALSPTSAETETTPEATPSATPKTTPGAASPTPTGRAKVTPSPKPTIETPAKPYIIIKDTPTGFLRVRMAPSTTATEAAQVKPGEMYHIYDEDNGWYQIRYEAESEGWVSGQYAEKVE